MDQLKRLQESIGYIENNLDNAIEIDELARIAAMSKFHYQRMFHILVNIPVGEYIRHRRLTRAAFHVEIAGGIEMEYRIEEHPEFTTVGHEIRTSTYNGENLKTIPAFWRDVSTDGRLVRRTVPSATWAFFESVGPVVDTIQETWRRVFAEWFPSTNYEHADGPALEVYFTDQDPSSPDHRCEVWILIRTR